MSIFTKTYDNLGISVLILIYLFATGCRDPEFETAPWRIDGFDPGVSGAGPAPLCPPGSEQPINNSLSPYEGGEVYPDLVVEIFSYFRCANCAKLSESLSEILVRREDIRERVLFYFHHFPLYEHETAMRLHAATIAVHEQDPAGFWQIHDMIFDALRQIPPQLYQPEDIEAFARDILKLDMAAYSNTANSDETMSRILWDKKQGTDLDLLGTPGIVICGRPVEGGWPELEAAVDEYLY
ncbi:MAG: thioredoxin domain-containing protein [Myxococcota bacterium]|nr:thioredoxin domain-containing protein [Myxococcota bacterium]